MAWSDRQLSISQQITALLCPQCGASLKHDSDHCDYCGSAIKHRQAPIPAKPPHGDVGLHDRCPRCHHRLHRNRIKAGRIRDCRQCGGVWVSHRTLKRLKRRKHKAARQIRKINKRRDSGFRLPAAHKHQTVRCPDCSRIMTPTINRGNATVVVDVCARHGIWFDEHELRNAWRRTKRHYRSRPRRESLFERGFGLRRGWRWHPLFIIIWIIVEIIDELLD